MKRHLTASAAVVLFTCVAIAAGTTQEKQDGKQDGQRRRSPGSALPPGVEQKKDAPHKPRKRPDGLIELNRQATVLVDTKRKRVLLKTRVCNREALLEMLVCLTERKLHESILVLDANALEVHSGLLAIGARPGSPAKFVPKYTPSHGQEVSIFLNWKDKQGRKHRCRAQEWIQHSVNRYHIQDLEMLPTTVKVPFDELRYDTRRKELLWFGPMNQAQYESLCELSDDKAYRTAIDAFRAAGRVRKMDARFMFAGSFFYEDEVTRRFYTAEAGYVVCVANLPEALVDVNVASSDSNGNLSYEARTAQIPPEGTEVTVELIPVAGSMLNARPPQDPAKAADAVTSESEKAKDAAEPKKESDKADPAGAEADRQSSGGA